MQDRRRQPRHPVLLRCVLTYGAERRDVICTQVGPGGAFLAQRIDLPPGAEVTVELRPGGLDTPVVRMAAEVARVVSGGGGSPAGIAVRWLRARCDLGQEGLLRVLHGVFRMSAFDANLIQHRGTMAELDMQLFLADHAPARERRNSVLAEARVSSGHSGIHVAADAEPGQSLGGPRPYAAVSRPSSGLAPAVRAVPASGVHFLASESGIASAAAPPGRTSSGPIALGPAPAAQTEATFRPATPPPLPRWQHPANPSGGLQLPTGSAVSPPISPQARISQSPPPLPAQSPLAETAAQPLRPVRPPPVAVPQVAGQRAPSAVVALPPAPRAAPSPALAGMRPPSRPGGQPGWRPPAIGMGPITDPFGFDLTVLEGAEASQAPSPPPDVRPVTASVPVAPAHSGHRIASGAYGSAGYPGATPPVDNSGPVPLAQTARTRPISGIHMPGPTAGARPRPISEIIAGQGPLTPLPERVLRPLSQPEMPLSAERTVTDQAALGPERRADARVDSRADPRVLQSVDLPVTWVRRHQLVAGTLVGLSQQRAAVLSVGPGPDSTEPVLLHVPMPVAGVWQTISLMGRLHQPVQAAPHTEGPEPVKDAIRFVVAIERVDEGKFPGALAEFLTVLAS